MESGRQRGMRTANLLKFHLDRRNMVGVGFPSSALSLAGHLYLSRTYLSNMGDDNATYQGVVYVSTALFLSRWESESVVVC